MAAAAKPSFLRRVRDALRADAALHDITDTQFMNGEDPLTARPVLPVETPAHGLSLETAPRDGTMVRLLIDFEGCDSWSPMTDDMQSWTVGFNHFDHDEQDEWIFVGWNWSQDCIIDCRAPGMGRVIGWLPLGGGLRPDTTAAGIYQRAVKDAAE
ncbi:hypothetical protein [Aureimonas sp. AU12]|uniref:hypothetical protein n=1 Tax=Aureimonas sp. AU12 TaxID=1638161 RepID=UPI0012E33BC9|nr:hypothetical protein [Aureimonas sp. AU12]